MLNDHRELSDPRRAMQIGMGMASPLWSTFFLAAGAGVAFWAWSQWARRPEFLGEAGPAPGGNGFASKPVVSPPPVLDAAPEPVEAAATEVVLDPVVEAPVLVQAVEPTPEAALPQVAPKAPRRPRVKAAAPAPEPAKTPVAKAKRPGKGGGARKKNTDAGSPRASVRRKANRRST